MASSAALQTGLHSFDSSLSHTHGRGDEAGLSTMLGSVAESFHSEDYDPIQPGGAGGWRRENGGGGGGGGSGGSGSGSGDEGGGRDSYGPSLLDEEEEQPPGDGLASLAEEDDLTLDDSQFPPPHNSRPPSTARTHSPLLSTGTTATTARTSLRPPSTASLAPSSRDTHHNSLDDDDDDDSAAAAGRVLGELDLDDDDDSRDDRYGRPPATTGRASVAGFAKDKQRKGDKGGDKGATTGHMTLREQEKVIDEFKKENFDLKLKIHFYEQRLDQLAPDQVNQTIRENISLKVEYNTCRTELKRHKKLLLDQDRVLETVSAERDAMGKGGRRERELEKELRRREQREEREAEERKRMEERIKDQASELRDLRDQLKKRRGDDWDGEDARAEISRLRDELDAEREAREDLLGEQDDLQRVLRETKDRLEDSQEARENESHSASVSIVGQRGRDKDVRRDVERLDRKVGDLEQEKASLRSQVTAQVTMLSTRNAEADALRDEVEQLKADLAHLEAELEQADRQRARSARASIGSQQEGGDKTREELEQDNAEYRDRASMHALAIEELERQLEEKEKEVEDLLQDLELRDEDHRLALKQTEDEWRQEVDDARAREEEAQGILEDKEGENEELADKVESLVRELEKKEDEMQADSAEVEALTQDLNKLGEQILALEDEAEEKDRRILELESELSAVDKEFEEKRSLHDQIVVALKEKLNLTKARLSELTIQHESTATENKFLREQVEDLAIRTAELEEKSRTELDTRRQLEDEVEDLVRALQKEEEERDLDQQEWNRQREEEEARWQRTFDAKDREIHSTSDSLASARAVLAARETDLAKLQDALNKIQSQSSQLNKSHIDDRFSLELELDRLKRDVKRYEEDVEREREGKEERERKMRERDLAFANLNSENKDLAAQVASLTQIRLTLTEKYDIQVKTLRDAQADLSAARDRLKVVEDQLTADHRTLSRTENQYRDQLTERNTLLLTIYQYMDKMVGGQSPRKAGTEPKPFTNFNVFHDSLISRLKSVNAVQLAFDRRTREIETKFQDQFNALKRQQESRLRQLDRFETALKAATETQRQWRQRVNSKQLELESAKATTAELHAQIASLRSRASTASSPDPGTSAKLAVLTTRASTAERRLASTQAQLDSAEEKLGEARTKISVAEGRWEARLRELQSRLHAAEEKVKRERQGAKERVGELTGTISNLEGQVSEARRRDHQLDEVIRSVDPATAHDKDTSID